MLKPRLVGLVCSSVVLAIWPAAAESQQFGRTTTYTYYDQPQQSSGSIIYSDQFYNSYPYSDRSYNNSSSYYYDRSERIDGFRQPSTVIIIQQGPVYDYPSSTCSTAVVGSPIPLPFARDTRTGLPCN